MAKFKVGDKVRVLPHNLVSYDMEKQIGKIGTITLDDGTGFMQYRLDIGMPRAPWHERCLELVEPRREFIVIHRSGNVMTAEHRVNREVIKSTKATCAPSDTFDFDTGAKLAFDRLMGREEPKPEPKPAHKFKVGDRVEYFARGIGVVKEINDTIMPHAPYKVNFQDGDMWLGDDRLFPAPEQPKYYTGKVVMVDCEFPARKYLINHMFEFKDGRQVGSKMHGMSFDCAPYTSFEQIVSIHKASTWIEVK